VWRNQKEGEKGWAYFPNFIIRGLPPGGGVLPGATNNWNRLGRKILIHIDKQSHLNLGGCGGPSDRRGPINLKARKQKSMGDDKQIAEGQGGTTGGREKGGSRATKKMR